MEFIVYNNETEEVLRTGSSPESMLSLQAGEGETVIEGVIHLDTQKIDNGQIVSRTTTEQDDYLYQQRLTRFPEIQGITDEELFNQVIHDHFLGRVDVTQWRIVNYSILRTLFYPPMTEYVDAQAKLSSSDPVIKQAGQDQLDQYNRDSLAVKARFPKPSN